MKMKKLISNLLAVLLVFSVVAVNVTDTSYAASSTSLGQVKSLKSKAQHETYPKYKLTWNSVKNATGYQIYVKFDNDKKWTKTKVKGKTSYMLEFESYGKDFMGFNFNYNVSIKVRAYKNINGVTTYGKFSKVKKIDISYEMPMHDNVFSAGYKLQKLVNFPSTLKIQSVYAGIGTMSDAEKRNSKYAGRYKQVIYIEYTAKDTKNQDYRGYIKESIYYVYGENDRQAVIDSPVTYELVNAIDEKDSVMQVDQPFFEAAKYFDGE